MSEPCVIRWRETEDTVIWTPPEPIAGEIIFGAEAVVFDDRWHRSRKSGSIPSTPTRIGE